MEAGEWVQVTGGNGAGKTTLLRLLTGLARPDGGEVYWQGEPLRRVRDSFHRSLLWIGHQPGWKKCRFSRAVTRDLIPGWCPIHSRLRWKLSRTRRRGSPCQYTSPPSGRASPVSRRSRVVFPAPLPPVTCTHSPASTVNDSPRNSVLSSRSQYRSLASSIPTHQRPVRNLV
ncbi:ABC transporter involved in cytochrome c biogenesis, ATPase component CcmA CDS [Salmonella enterica subsp. enterica serovar Derby]|nr:ABC transporter involved in cytochrome c biogenesis, ATPase component CcmA CDS [Salmonella enterica subsp. enterica serovar Derby]